MSECCVSPPAYLIKINSKTRTTHTRIKSNVIRTHMRLKNARVVQCNVVPFVCCVCILLNTLFFRTIIDVSLRARTQWKVRFYGVRVVTSLCGKILRRSTDVRRTFVAFVLHRFETRDCVPSSTRRCPLCACRSTCEVSITCLKTHTHTNTRYVIAISCLALKCYVKREKIIKSDAVV